MPRYPILILALAPSLLLGGCLAKAAVGVVTAPVRIASKGVDLATTSQSEADENRGRELRRREERYGELEREYARQTQRCEQGRTEACDRARAAYDEMTALRPSIPVEPTRR